MSEYKTVRFNATIAIQIPRIYSDGSINAHGEAIRIIESDDAKVEALSLQTEDSELKAIGSAMREACE